MKKSYCDLCQKEFDEFDYSEDGRISMSRENCKDIYKNHGGRELIEKKDVCKKCWGIAYEYFLDKNNFKKYKELEEL